MFSCIGCLNLPESVVKSPNLFYVYCCMVPMYIQVIQVIIISAVIFVSEIASPFANELKMRSSGIIQMSLGYAYNL